MEEKQLQDQPAPDAVPEVKPEPVDDWRERLDSELADLTVKITKLSAFLTKVEEGKQTLDPVSHGLLVAQHGAMTSYQAILFIRINTTVKQTA
jgi:hypothetical protein